MYVLLLLLLSPFFCLYPTRSVWRWMHLCAPIIYSSGLSLSVYMSLSISLSVSLSLYFSLFLSHSLSLFHSLSHSVALPFSAPLLLGHYLRIDDVANLHTRGSRTAHLWRVFTASGSSHDLSDRSVWASSRSHLSNEPFMQMPCYEATRSFSFLLP